MIGKTYKTYHFCCYCKFSPYDAALYCSLQKEGLNYNGTRLIIVVIKLEYLFWFMIIFWHLIMIEYSVVVSKIGLYYFGAVGQEPLPVL